MTTFKYAIENGNVKYIRKSNICPIKIRDIRVLKHSSRYDHSGLIVARDKFHAACIIP